MDQSTLNALAGALASSQKANSTLNRGTFAGGQYMPPSGLGWAGNATQAFAPALQAYLKQKQQQPPVAPQQIGQPPQAQAPMTATDMPISLNPGMQSI